MKPLLTAIPCVLALGCFSTSISAETTAISNADGQVVGADLIISGGPILTMEGAAPSYVEAVVVSDGRIIFAGPLAEANKRKVAGTVVKNLDGRAMLPGFIDGHSHFMFAINMANQVNVAASPVGPGDTIPKIISAPCLRSWRGAEFQGNGMGGNYGGHADTNGRYYRPHARRQDSRRAHHGTRLGAGLLEASATF
jgi:hypothetical protein